MKFVDQVNIEYIKNKFDGNSEVFVEDILSRYLCLPIAPVEWGYTSLAKGIYIIIKNGVISFMSVVLLLPVSFAGVGLRDTSIASMLSIFNVNKGSSLVITMSMLMAQIVAALIGGLYAIKKSIEKT